jgi:hypothetical protein
MGVRLCRATTRTRLEPKVLTWRLHFDGRGAVTLSAFSGTSLTFANQDKLIGASAGGVRPPEYRVLSSRHGSGNDKAIPRPDRKAPCYER